MNSKEQIDELMKPRSYRAVVSSGFRFYTAHFRTVFKSSWLMALAYSLMVGLTGLVAAVQMHKVVMKLITLTQHGADSTALIDSQKSYFITGGLLVVFVIVCMLLLAVTIGCVLTRLKEHKENHTLVLPTSWWKPNFLLAWRTVKGGIFTSLLTIIPIALLAGGTIAYSIASPQSFATHSTTVCVAVVILSLLIIAFGLPIVPTLIHYIFSERTPFLQALRANYKGGLRFWGGLFAIVIIDVLWAIIVDLIICLPAKILFMANLSAQTGQLYGDPLSMPAYMPMLTFVTFTICGFFQFFATLPALFHSYYAYGAIVSREQERFRQAK